MKGKYKMTGCARFIIFLIILIPIAYFGSKYLRESGTWDKIKDKVEQNEGNSVDRTIQEKRDRIEKPADNSDLQNDFSRLREAYEEQEELLAEQEQTIKNLQDENDALKLRLNEAPASTSSTRPTTIPTRTEPANNNNSGTPSLDDLLREADSNLGTSSGNTGGSSLGGNRENLGKWNFSFSGSSGDIEFYRQNGKLFASTSIQGDNRINIDELTPAGDRFTVNNSVTGEYYVLLNNGNLEAYDRNGFQTTCTRAN